MVKTVKEKKDGTKSNDHCFHDRMKGHWKEDCNLSTAHGNGDAQIASTYLRSILQQRRRLKVKGDYLFAVVKKLFGIELPKNNLAVNVLEIELPQITL